LDGLSNVHGIPYQLRRRFLSQWRHTFVIEFDGQGVRFAPDYGATIVQWRLLGDGDQAIEVNSFNHEPYKVRDQKFETKESLSPQPESGVPAPASIKETSDGSS
jgi:hypothetical protein